VQPVCDGGGSEHALVAMIRQLTSAGWECHVALPGPPVLADEYGAAGATVHVVPMARLTTSGGPGRWPRYAARWPVAVDRLRRLVRSVDADVVHSNSLHCWYGWAAARLTGRPHVWHAREIVFQSPAALAVERFLTAHFADVVVAVSAAVATQLPGADVVVVLDRPDPARFDPTAAGEFRAAMGIADDVPLVGSVARIDTWKGFDTLLDAVPLVRRRRPEVEMVVAGAAVPGKERYEADLRRVAADNGVHWLGPRRDIGALMADLDVFVQVSSEPEPYGLVVAEALASGTPVVAGNAGGPVEILAHAPPGAGRLVPPGDPESLAEAVLALLPDEPSNTQRRRSRPPLLGASADEFPALFARVVEAAASGGGRPSGARHRLRHARRR